MSFVSLSADMFYLFYFQRSDTSNQNLYYVIVTLNLVPGMKRHLPDISTKTNGNHFSAYELFKKAKKITKIVYQEGRS